jgi:eukaryotic-like serine/threonine-protein kinase
MTGVEGESSAGEPETGAKERADKPSVDLGSITSSWSDARAAFGNDPERARVAIARLAERYWGPVRTYLLHSGRNESEAEALWGQFFLHLGQRHSQRPATQAKESFRVWLFRELEEFLAAAPGAATLPDPPPASTRESSRPSSEPVVPGYQALEPIGVGADGTVYRAYDARSQRQVALKVLHPAKQRDVEVVDRFRKSVAIAGALDHPNIIRIYDPGNAGSDLAYCAMQLVAGGRLSEPAQQARFREPERATRLVIQLARALHHAHQHGVLHRGLSPASVLVDRDDEPHLGGFLGKRFGQAGAVSAEAISYSAPEAACGGGGTLDADVYSLAAVLYELWVGKPPIRASSLDEAARAHERELARPRSVAPGVSLELEAVCMAALSRDPQARHPSAASFADNLERAISLLPPYWPKTPRKRRAWLWVKRRPFLAASAVLGAALLVLADWFTVASVRKQHADMVTATLHSNAALANSQARAVLALFEKFAEHAARTAAEPEVRAIAERGQRVAGPAVLQRVFERTGSFDSVGIFTKDGRIIARYPEPDPGFLGREFKFRAYYKCIQALVGKAASGFRPAEPEVCVSPAYRGESSGQIEFTVAAPLYSESGADVGFVLLNKHAKHTLEEIEIDDVYRSGQTTALFGQRGSDRTVAAPPDGSKLTAVAHPGLFSVEERALAPALSRKLIAHLGEPATPGFQLQALRVRPLEEADYVDPVTLETRLAGFAPVGRTGFVVAVSTPKDRALLANRGRMDALWQYAVMLNLGFLILVGVALRASLRDTVPARRE